MQNQYNVKIIEHGTGRIVKKIGPYSNERLANIQAVKSSKNLNHERFYTVIEEQEATA